MTFEVTPVAAAGTTTGSAVASSGLTVTNSAPTASSVSITDNNVTLTGNYSYADADSDAEGSSTFRWLRDGLVISGETTKTYTVVATDIGKVMTFEVTPVAAAGTTTGSMVASSGLTVTNRAPTASSVSITDSNGGTADMGDTLTGSYTYADIDGDNEGASTFRWLRDGTAISGATKSTYNIIASGANAALTFEVIPIAAAGTTTGSAVTSSSITISAISNPLNDTGITKCGDYAYIDTGTYPTTGSLIHNNDLDCSVQATVPTQTTDGYDADGDIIRAGQDALYGRDATNNDNSNGHAGFDFTKLDSSGIALTDQTVVWDASTGGSEAAFSRWSCVKDNVTGLTWEVKAAAGSGLQANDYTYTWYTSTTTNDGGDHGIGDKGVSTTTNYELTPSTAIAGSDNCSNTSRCDTEKYVVDVNASNLGAGICGATDWRLPTKHELVSIVNNSGVSPAIEANYFPNTLNTIFWSSSPYANYNYHAWDVNLNNGSVGYDDKSDNYYVRLVRGSN